MGVGSGLAAPSDLRGRMLSKASMLCRSRKALPKRRARKMAARREAAVAVGGQGGRRVAATALSNLCRTQANRSCNNSSIDSVTHAAEGLLQGYCTTLPSVWCQTARLDPSMSQQPTDTHNKHILVTSCHQQADADKLVMLLQIGDPASICVVQLRAVTRVWSLQS